MSFDIAHNLKRSIELTRTVQLILCWHKLSHFHSDASIYDFLVATAPTPNDNVTVSTKICTGAKVVACGWRLRPLLRQNKKARSRLRPLLVWRQSGRDRGAWRGRDCDHFFYLKLLYIIVCPYFQLRLEWFQSMVVAPARAEDILMCPFKPQDTLGATRLYIHVSE